MFDYSECIFQVYASFCEFAAIALDHRNAAQHGSFCTPILDRAAKLKSLFVKIERLFPFSKQSINGADIAHRDGFARAVADRAAELKSLIKELKRFVFI